MKQVKAIIFDADGPLYYRTEQVKRQKEALLKEFGYSDNPAIFETAYEKEKLEAYIGKETVSEMFKKILEQLGLSISQEQAGYFATKFNSIKQQVTPTKDALTTLSELKKNGLKTCVLTDSFYSEVEKWSWFERIGMRPYIDAMVSSFDIRQLKDTAEAYQACLDKLRVSVNEAIFVGHQQYEMDGAKKSHIISVAVSTIAPADIQSDYKVETLSELPSLIKRMGGN